MRILLMLTAIVVAVPDRPDSTKKPGKPIQEQIIGEWQVTKAVRGGRDEMDKKEAVLIFGKDTIQIREDGKIQPRDNANYRIDATQNPIHLDITVDMGPKERLLGILKLEGDELIICFSHDRGENRPLNFESTPDSQTMVIHMRRIKK